MAKAYARYTVKVGSFKGGKRFDVKDNQFGSHDYAFSKPDGSIYSYSPVAEDFVNRVLGMDESMVEMLQPGKCYRVMTDGVFGGLLEIWEVPASWYNL